MPLILASASSIRRSMLDAAGIEYRAEAASIDESECKRLSADPRQITIELAKAKALDVSAREPGVWVIGSDSVVSVAGRLFDKPSSRDEAAEHLRFFSGREIELTSAAALAKKGVVDWAHSDSARLQVRILSRDFVASYLDREWPAIGNCVGVFRMEGYGVHLFDRIDGDHFTILGMPLISLLAALREREAIVA